MKNSAAQLPDSVTDTTRRTMMRWLLGAGASRFLAPLLTAAPVMPVDRLISDHFSIPARATYRRYRAHAYIHLLAIPICSRQDVGGGYAVIEEAAAGEHSLIGLQFAGGSSPARARGLNRVGLIQEVLFERNGDPAESAYFGFMVSSTEKNLDQARKSLQTDTAGSIPYSAAFGSGRAGSFHCAISHLPAPARYDWTSFDQLDRDLRPRISGAADTRHFDVPLASAASRPNTFLYSMRRAILSDSARMTAAIVYNGKRYAISTEKQPDMHTGQQLANRGVTPGSSPIWRLNGDITEGGTREASNFQVWYEHGDPSGLPVRIEFYPKSFLKLVFEQDHGQAGPALSYLLKRR